jgi:predicted ATPase
MEKKMEKEIELKFKFDKDFRTFKAGTEFTIPVKRFAITYLCGLNGSGKSSLLRTIRCKKDSLREDFLRTYDGVTNSMLEEAGHTFRGTIEGLDEYDEVFCLDSQVDDPLNFSNASTAVGLVNGRGLAGMHSSRGQLMGTKFVEFINKVNARKDKSKRTLIILDEVDEGLDMRIQFRWNKAIENRLILETGADVICVSHNPLCMLSESIMGVRVIDMENGSVTTPNAWIRKEFKADVKVDFED